MLAASCGFVHLFSPTSTLEHNGFSEHANCTILDKARCLLLTSNLFRSYWAKAVNTASFLSNLVPTPSRDSLSPFSLWSSKPSRIKRLKNSGCKAFILVHKSKREWKLSPTSKGDKFPSLHDKPNIPTCSKWVEISQEDDKKSFDCEEIEPEETDDLNVADQINETSPPTEQTQIPEGSASCYPDTHRRIKVIGPQHPTLIQGDVDAQNILPYSQRPRTFIA
ncbi:hypothetical protein O181_042668 [Austropuccinia psidii MF-1]|uniref:Integrase catalytic domain-containing protein n=1 Tax=Austropuccinia psidii MF-1 TaxID=1389203 RepID=A0A9Q3DJU4_9BASI|nr:hypothetical protein [Austropuccinia psidii MF-1]